MNKNRVKNNEPGKKRSGLDILLDYLHDFVFLLAILLVVFVLLFRIVVVSGPSMESTLTDGDYLLVLGSAFYSDPQPGDIVIISKDDFKSGDPIVKRVIATEGQTVVIEEGSSNVYVDGVLLEEPYIKAIESKYGDINVTVEPGHVFVLGDNRGNSTDSRSHEVGQIDVREIVGKAVFLVFPGSNVRERDLGRIGVP